MNRFSQEGSQFPAYGAGRRTHLPPTMARLYEVAADLSRWSDEEQAWLDDHPEWIQREARLKLALDETEPDCGGVFAMAGAASPKASAATEQDWHI